MIHEARVRRLNDEAAPAAGRYVLYWMQQSQRARFNHALEYAIRAANASGKPLLVGFGITDDYPEANGRHYRFMLEGLRDVERALRSRGVRFVVRRGQPQEVAVALAREATLVVCDRGYLRHQRRWRDHVADRAGRQVIEVESDVVVPVETASDKAEYAARTIRPKIHRHLVTFLADLAETEVEKPSLRIDVEGDVDLSDLEATLKKLKLDTTVPPSPILTGGSSAAKARLDAFLAGPLDGYADGRREPAGGGTSMLAAYLHFGQVSPLEIALRVRDSKRGTATDREAFLEELIVRRELAMNYVHYSPADYDAYRGLPAWSRKTLAEHRDDPRPHVYTRGELESADTHDPYWNAAQREMTLTGYMHNSMRMYWGKKILEWTNKPESAFQTALYLNNRHFLCGRDPASYANVAWLFGLHDRPWGPERKVFGTVRYMNAAGLERKFDMDAYLAKVDRLTRG